MALMIESLGKAIERLTTELRGSCATATRDIAYPGGIVKQGTVAGQHTNGPPGATAAP